MWRSPNHHFANTDRTKSGFNLRIHKSQVTNSFAFSFPLIIPSHLPQPKIYQYKSQDSIGASFHEFTGLIHKVKEKETASKTSQLVQSFALRALVK